MRPRPANWPASETIRRPSARCGTRPPRWPRWPNSSRRREIAYRRPPLTPGSHPGHNGPPRPAQGRSGLLLVALVVTQDLRQGQVEQSPDHLGPIGPGPAGDPLDRVELVGPDADVPKRHVGRGLAVRHHAAPI